MLKSETNTPEVQKQVEEAADDAFGPDSFDTFYEHGQWWVTVFGVEDDGHTVSNLTYSVVDVNTGINHDLDFELL